MTAVTSVLYLKGEVVSLTIQFVCAGVGTSAILPGASNRMAPVTSSEAGFVFKSVFGGLSASLAGMLPVGTSGASVRPGSFGEALCDGASDDAALAGSPDGTVPSVFGGLSASLAGMLPVDTSGASVRPGSFGEALCDGASDDAALAGSPDGTVPSVFGGLSASLAGMLPVDTSGASVRPGSFGEALCDGASDDAALAGSPDGTVPSVFGGLSASLAGMLPVDTSGASVRPGSFGEALCDGASDDAALAGSPDGTVPSVFGGLSASLAGMLPVDTSGASVRPGSFGEALCDGASDDAALAGGPDGTVPEEFSEAVAGSGRACSKHSS